MRDYLKTLPQWALIGLLLITGAATVYAVNTHLATDNQQSQDIKSLASVVGDMRVVVEYNMKEVERFHDTEEDLRETQMQLQRLVGLIEANMKENN